jgi:hypothetical protein
VYTGGFHSPDDLVRILREAHNIQPLPPASALVAGTAKDSTQYKPLSAAEALQLQQQDNAGVEKMLRSEVDQIRSLAKVLSPAGGPVEDSKTIASEKRPREDSR